MRKSLNGLLAIVLLFFIQSSLRAQHSWVQNTKSLPEKYWHNDYGIYGSDVAIEGDIAVVAAKGDSYNEISSGKVYVLQKNGNEWLKIAILGPSDAFEYQNFGYSVAISENNIVVGANRDNANGTESGAVYVFTKPEAGWTDMQQTAKLLPLEGHENQHFGGSVAISGNQIIIGATGDDTNENNSGAVYIFEKPENGWADMTSDIKLTSGEPEEYDYFGSSVAIHNDQVVIGAENHSNFGAAYVFEKPDDGWENMTHTAKLIADNNSQPNRFGHSLAIEDNHIVISAIENFEFGESFSAYVFKKPEDGWIDSEQNAKLTISDIAACHPEIQQGFSVDMSGNQIVLGFYQENVFCEDNPDQNNKNYVFLFEKSGDDWQDMSQTAILSQEGYNEYGSKFGDKVAIDGDNIIAGDGMIAINGYHSGAAYFYEKPISGWVNAKENFRTIPDPFILSNRGDGYGYEVAIDGDYAVTGSFGSDVDGIESGVAYVLKRTTSGWERIAKLTPSDGGYNHQFGHSMAISGDQIAISSIVDHQDGLFRGAVYIFEKSESGWVDTNEVAKLTLSNQNNYDQIGYDVAISSDGIVVVGAPNMEYNGPGSGAVFIFKKSEAGWQNTNETAILTPSDAADYDRFGTSVAIDGNTVVVGSSQMATQNVFGAAYVFEKPEEGWQNINETAKFTPTVRNVYDYFGHTVDISGDQIVVGAYQRHDESYNRTGAAYMFIKPENGWQNANEDAMLLASDGADYDQFGLDVAISDNIVVVASHLDDYSNSQYERGSAYVFVKPESGWQNDTESFKIIPEDHENYDYFGRSIDISNGNIVVGANGIDDHGEESGATFFFEYLSVNSAPTLIPGSDISVSEDAGLQNFTSWATQFNDGDPEDQNLSLEIYNDNNDLFEEQPYLNIESGDLTFKANPDAYGTAVVSIILKDDGGTEGGGADQTSYTLNITVLPVNDAPSFTLGEDQSVLEDAGAQTISAWATSISTGPVNENQQSLTFNINNDNTSLFEMQPFIDGNSGDLSFTPASNANGSATITIILTDDGGNENGGINFSETYTFIITVNPVNDAPSLVIGEYITILEDNGNQIIAAWATEIATGPSNESDQLLTLNFTSDNSELFEIQPYFDFTTGDLHFTTASNAYGTANITISITDNGGTENGGIDTSEEQIFSITTIPVNDAPTFVTGADPRVFEDSGSPKFSGWATNITSGAANESNQSVEFIVNTNNLELFAILPKIDAITGDLTFTPALNAHGLAICTVTLSDDGDNENGGSNISEEKVFTITITEVNDLPRLSLNIEDQIAEVNTKFIFTIDNNTFTDDDSDDQLTYFASVEGEGGLFDWLSFDSNTRIFSGTPTPKDVGTFSIKVVVTDTKNTSASTVFKITVNNVTGLKTINNKEFLNVYPNPTHNAINLESRLIKGNDIMIRLINLKGEIIFKTDEFTNKIDISSQPNGIYILQLIQDGSIQSLYKIIKN